MPDKVLVTGATGFLGSHLAHALLESGKSVVALGRASSRESARTRVLSVMRQIAEPGSVSRSDLNRLEVVDGDISEPNLGLDQAAWDELTRTVVETWHSAASLSFSEADRDAIFRMNVDGTRRVLDLAARTRTGRFHHVSTAYVAGLRQGRVFESESDVGQEFRNPYEASKCRAETLVAGQHAEGSVSATIYRPSVVIGDSVTGRATHLHGVYAFIKGMWSLAERVRRRTGADIVELPMRVRGSLDATLNFVPIDYVTSGMIHIGSLPTSPGGTYHMANPEATPNRMWLGIVSEQLGIRGIELVEPDSFERTPMTKLETLFHRQMAFYYQYLMGEPVFDCTNALDALQGTGIECPRVTGEFNRKMTGWYIDRLNVRLHDRFNRAARPADDLPERCR